MLTEMTAEPVFKAMAEPRRREMLRMLANRELTVGAIADRFDVTQPAISQHLKVLVEAGLVGVRQEGTRRYYRSLPGPMEELREYLAGYWMNSLERLKRAAEEEERRPDDASIN